MLLSWSKIFNASWNVDGEQKDYQCNGDTGWQKSIEKGWRGPGTTVYTDQIKNTLLLNGLSHQYFCLFAPSGYWDIDAF